MTIATRPDWNGNTSVRTFDDVTDALTYMKTNPCYEIIQEDVPVRPYGDIDLKVDVSMSETEFNHLDMMVYQELVKLFEDEKEITIFSASSYDYRKISHRWTMPNYYVKSQAHAKKLAEDFYSKISLPSGAVGDLSVYSKNRKMRTMWTSKPNENRPFYMIQGEEEDHLITYIPKWAKEIPIELEEKHVEYKPVCTEYESTYITQLCDCISVSTWDDYTSCQSLIFTLLSLGVNADVIHFYCAKSSKYSRKWVHDYIIRYNPRKNCHTIGTLKHFARRDNLERYTSLQSDPIFKKQMSKRMFQEMIQLTEDIHTKHDWCDENGFLKPLPQVKTLAVKSHLGTGKTRECIRACTPSPFNMYADKILVMSARQTFTSHITAELPGFTDYREIKEKVINHDKVVVQLQSLWKCKDMESRDLILLDEVESLLMSLTPNKTHKNYTETFQAFEKLIREAKRVIVLDAFLTDRTMNLLRTLRGDVTLVINPHCPYKKTAEIVTEKDLYGKIRLGLQNKKRLISVWGAKNKATAFHSLLPSNVNHVLYTGSSDPKQKDEHLKDVNTHWANYQLVGYTATITVGVNYNGELFDEATLYATPWSCVSRDYIQALHRARKLRNNHITAYISEDPRPCSFEAGLSEQERQFQEQTDRVKKFLHDIGQSPIDYSLLPPWLHSILMWNLNETITNYKYFPECMKGYFDLCGITYEGSSADEDVKTEKQKSYIISVEDVQLIDQDTAEAYSRNRNILTETQQYELEKYYMTQKVTRVDQFIWEAWLQDRKKIERSYSVMNHTPEDLIRDKYIELVPRDAERLKLFQDLQFNWSEEWSLKPDDIPVIDLQLFGIRMRSEKDTHIQYCRDLCKALKSWCGVHVKVDRKRVRTGSELDYSYTLTYNPCEQVFSYIPRKGDVFDIEL